MSKIISFEPSESVNDSQNDEVRQSKKRKIGFQPNVLESVENTLTSREERSCNETNGQVGHKRKRGGQISVSGPKEPTNMTSPSPVKKALIRSSSSLRAAVTRVQVRKPLPNFHVSFGRPLSEVIPTGEQVPVVVSECIRFLIPQFISEEGIFRKSGSQQSIQSIRQAIDATGQVREIITSESDCHAIAGVLKLFIREMPESLIPFDLQDKFLEVVRNKEIASNPETQITMLQAALAELDQNEYTLVRVLCQMNYQISLHHEENLMTPNNLARVWAPNMIKTNSVNPMEIMQFTDHANILMTVLITQSPFLFKQENTEVQSEELACMAASASIDESMKEYSNLSKTPSLNSLMSSSQRLELGDMIVEEPITPRSISSENQDDGSDSLMRSSSDLATKYELARSSSDISEKKTSSFDNVNEKRKQLIKRTSMMGKNIIKAHQTPSKNHTNAPVEEPSTPSQVTIAPEAISTPSRPQIHRTRSSVFKNLNNISRTSLETSNSNITMEEPANDSLVKSLSKSNSLELSSKSSHTKPKISLLYYEPTLNSLLDQKVKDLSVPRLKNRVESKQPISVDEATKIAKTCKKLILIDSKTEQVTHSLYLSDMTDLEIKKSIINIETFNLVCPSLVVKTSKKESFLVIGWSAFVWNSILENEDCSYLSM